MKRTVFSYCLLLWLGILPAKYGFSQYGIYDTIKHEAIVYNGDTMELKTLDVVYLYTQLTKAQRKAYAKYNRLRNAVFVTYPYARQAGIVFNEMNAKLETMHVKDEKKKYIKSREKDLRKKFAEPLTNLSVYQGKVLMKLINRETGNNCYEIIKEYKGSLTARFYQTVAFFFDSNLKQSYNEKKEDAVIEKFVQEVQHMYGYKDIRRNSLTSR